MSHRNFFLYLSTINQAFLSISHFLVLVFPLPRVRSSLGVNGDDSRGGLSNRSSVASLYRQTRYVQAFACRFLFVILRCCCCCCCCCLFVCLFVRSFVCLFVCLPVCLFLCFFVSSFLCLLACLFVCFGWLVDWLAGWLVGCCCFR